MLYFSVYKCVLLDHGISLRFVLVLALRVTFQANKNVRSTPASSALTQVSHQSHNARTANYHLHGSVERNALVEPYCSWQKGTSPDEATLNSEDIKAVAIASIELHLSEGICKSLGRSVGQLVSQ